MTNKPTLVIAYESLGNGLTHQPPVSPKRRSGYEFLMLVDDGTKDGGAVLMILPSSTSDDQLHAVADTMGWDITAIERRQK